MQSRQRPQSRSSGGVASISTSVTSVPEHDPRAVLAGDQHRVLAVEADSGPPRSLAIDVLVLVHEDAVVTPEPLPELLEPAPQDRVVVAPGVPRQTALAGTRLGPVTQ